MRSVNSIMRSSHYVLFVFALFMRSFYAPFVFSFFMCSFNAVFLCALCIRSFYVVFVFALLMCSFNALYLCAFFIRLFYVLFSCAILMSSFHKRLAILHMHKKYYCTKTNMADDKMDDVLKKLGLSDYRARFVEGKISTDIACYLSIEEFHKLVLTDRNAIMSLRIECSTFGLCTPQRAVGTNKFVIPKILIENLIDVGIQ